MSTYLDRVHAVTEKIESAPSSPLERLYASFQGVLYLPDLVPLDIALATFLAHRLGGDPVWTLLVGAPSSGKSEILRSFYGLPEVHPVSSLTPQTFASGLKGRAEASLLCRLEREGKSFVVLKDFTTVLTLHREARQEILAQLREIYDGSFTKEFGTGVSVRWEGCLGVLAGVTPIVDNHRVVNALLGERFVYLRLPPADRRLTSRAALRGRAREEVLRRDLQDAVAGFLEGLVDTEPREFGDKLTERIVTLADLTSLARSGVERDAYSSRDIIAVPEPEAPARLAKQLAGLAAGLRVMGFDEDAVSQRLRRVAYDCLPRTRLAVMRLLRPRLTEPLDTPTIAAGVGLPPTSARRHLEDLAALRVVERTPGLGGRGGADRWHLADHFRQLWDDADPPEFDTRKVGTGGK